MNEHNKPIALTPNKQKIINNPNTYDVYNEVDALKKVIYKLGIKQDFTLQQTVHFKYDKNVYQMHIFIQSLLLVGFVLYICC